MQEYRIRLLFADLTRLVDQPGVSAVAFAGQRLFRRAGAAEFVGLFESAVYIVRMQNSQIEGGQSTVNGHQQHEQQRQLAGRWHLWKTDRKMNEIYKFQYPSKNNNILKRQVNTGVSAI